MEYTPGIVRDLINKQSVFDRASLRCHKNGTFTVSKWAYCLNGPNEPILDSMELEDNLRHLFEDRFRLIDNTRHQGKTKNRYWENVVISWQLDSA